MGLAPLPACLPCNHWQYNVRRPFCIVKNRLQGWHQIGLPLLAFGLIKGKELLVT